MTKILLVGGGSGGHIIPTLAVAESLKSKSSSVELLYIGSTRPQDAEIVRGVGLEFRAIAAGKLRRYFDWQNFRDAFYVIVGFFQALLIVREFRPDVVFARGGFVLVPVVWAAKIYGVPIVLHESDSIIGLSNRLAAPYAMKIATAFPVEVYPARWQTKMMYTGLPLSKAFLRTEPAKLSQREMVVALGGSQGARAVNDLIWENLVEILAKYDLIHQVGAAGMTEAEAIRHNLPPEARESYLPIPFDTSFRQHVQAASVVVTRAGSSLHELAAWGAPVICIPLPGSASDHQAANAKWYGDQGAVIVLEQGKTTPQRLWSVIEEVAGDTTRAMELRENIKKLGAAHHTAADKVAELILEIAGK